MARALTTSVCKRNRPRKERSKDSVRILQSVGCLSSSFWWKVVDGRNLRNRGNSRGVFSYIKPRRQLKTWEIFGNSTHVRQAHTFFWFQQLSTGSITRWRFFPEDRGWDLVTLWEVVSWCLGCIPAETWPCTLGPPNLSTLNVSWRT